MSDAFDNVATLPPRGEASRGPVETLVDVLKDCEAGQVEDVLIVTRDSDGYLDVSFSSQSSGDVAEMALYLQRAAGDLVEAMNERREERPEPEEEPET